MKKPNLTGMTIQELEEFTTGLGEKPFRGRQLFAWIYAKGVRDFSAMTDIAKPLRARFQENAEIGCIEEEEMTVSETTSTRKFLFRLTDGECIESVYIPEDPRRTLCISSQVGCPLGCTFCATGRMGYRRNLTVGEIVDQVIHVERAVETELTNVVLMGMGEPLLNYENVIAACQLIRHENGLAISQRRIVISTAGWVPGIVRLTEEGHRFKLAVSLNASTDEHRREIMPIAKEYPLGELMNAVEYYYKKSRRSPTFEYVLLAGINDAVQDARRLRRLLSRMPCKINLIPYNPVEDSFQRPTDETIERFREQLAPLKAPVIIRWSKGDDIRAACGQLAGHSLARN